MLLIYLPFFVCFVFGTGPQLPGQGFVLLGFNRIEMWLWLIFFYFWQFWLTPQGRQGAPLISVSPIKFERDFRSLPQSLPWNIILFLCVFCVKYKYFHFYPSFQLKHTVLIKHKTPHYTYIDFSVKHVTFICNTWKLIIEIDTLASFAPRNLQHSLEDPSPTHSPTTFTIMDVTGKYERISVEMYEEYLKERS